METTQAPYTIYAESTPNPNTLKFVANRWLVTNDKSYEVLADQRVGGPSPLAEQLFSFPFINGVFIAGNFVTITKAETIEWQDVMIELRDFISDFLNTEGNEIIREEVLNQTEEQEAENATTTEGSTAKTDLTDFDKKIVEILNEYIKPAVESDGGAIEFHSYDAGLVKVILKGACSGCPSSTATLKGGIESLLKSMLPEVKEVEAING
ncbi:NifU family protein [Vicingaceae bacterium]|jgi:Fe-S cluster biogenesis protein NfuA|nr:NifU family protein [Vicingaceae bacterium]